MAPINRRLTPSTPKALDSAAEVRPEDAEHAWETFRDDASAFGRQLLDAEPMPEPGEPRAR